MSDSCYHDATEKTINFVVKGPIDLAGQPLVLSLRDTVRTISFVVKFH